MGIRAKVLFVDDEPAILEGLRQVLRPYPFEIFTATSGPDGMKVLEQVSIDVVVSDERMPGMSGSEFLTAVCHAYPATIRIILTGQATLDAAVHAVNEGGIYRFLLKPCKPDELADTILHGLDLRDLRRDAPRLLMDSEQSGALLRQLERLHPGIAKRIRTADGAILLDLEAAAGAELMRKIRSELAATAGEPPH